MRDMADPVRNEALAALQKLFTEKPGHASLSQALAPGLKNTAFSDTDKRFLRRLATGVTERKAMLEGMLRLRSTVDPKKMKPLIRMILMCGLYELFFMDTKPYAVVSEYVKLAEKRGFYGLKGFVNGFLRSVGRDIDEKGKVRALESLTEALSLRERLCLPEELYELFSSWFDEETLISICLSFLNEDRELTVRLMKSNATKEALRESLAKEGIVLKENDYSDSLLQETCFTLENVNDLTGLEAFQKGWFYIQSLSSQLDCLTLSDILRENREIRVYDACSSPGGKSIDLSDENPEKAQILACDTDEERLAAVQENIKRLHIQNIRTEVRDATVFEPAFEQAFDIVICDAPCSGLGTIGKNPDIRLNVTKESVKRIGELQRAILDNVSRYVKPGGVLIYSTCTVNPGENTEQTAAFLQKHKEFVQEEAAAFLPEKLKQAAAGKDILMLPGMFSQDGFYVCRMRRL